MKREKGNCTDLFPVKQLYREKTGWTLGLQDYFEPLSSGVCGILNGLFCYTIRGWGGGELLDFLSG